ncbi:MAG: PLP-dependent aminotransferase family protein [Ferrovibrio sp.]|uniref:MocR-like pyridoxine biosynthesis transcription factor PdxR n=1 Tax=Ferrovibrio sp. TaxID=1917215 RepID=UPI002604EA56|nr:PLP-dependent aminotransferase family protein [Ferrovibrio sp.]MCW0234177.1 PLP-dependent aminotransferase family protein [Ferrovibrio sp.]
MPPLLDALAFDLQRSGGAPLHRQIQSRLVAEITAGALKPGARLPSSRALAELLGVSRNTVMLVFEQLIAEGYLDGQTGSGTYVSRSPPGLARKARPAPRINPVLPAASSLDRGRSFARFSDVPETFRRMRRPVAFRANFPAVDAFPVQLWAKLTMNLFRRMDASAASHLLGEGDPQGYHPLRECIAEHLALSRGVHCSAANVVIFAGVQHAADTACRLLLMPGDRAWCEDPGYDGAYAAITAASAHPCPVPVDDQGIDVAAGLAAFPDARFAYVTPSKQYPLGMAMSLERRTQLLDWARVHDSWIIEDDYDSEFRYGGRPLPPLQALDTEGRVIYLGTFSKCLFPALRLGYAVVADALIEYFVAARTVVGRYSPILDQILVANFMAEGHFAAHVARMRKLYVQRQASLLEAVARDLGDYMTAEPSDSGMELLATLRPGFDAIAIARAAAAEGLEVMPVSFHTQGQRPDPRLLLGFGAFTPAQIDDGARHLRWVISGMMPQCNIA